MGGYEIAELLEWMQGFVEQRLGMFWSWVVYAAGLAAVVGSAIWLLHHFARHVAS